MRNNSYGNKKFEESKMFQEAYVLSRLQEMTGDALYKDCRKSFQDKSSAIEKGVRFGMFVRNHTDWFDPSPESVVRNCILRGLEENDRRREGKKSEAIPITSLLIRIAYFMAGVEMEKRIHKMYVDKYHVDDAGYPPYVTQMLGRDARFNGFHFGARDTLIAKEQNDIANKVYKIYFDILDGNEEDAVSEDEFKQGLGL